MAEAAGGGVRVVPSAMLFPESRGWPPRLLRPHPRVRRAQVCRRASRAAVGVLRYEDRDATAVGQQPIYWPPVSSTFFLEEGNGKEMLAFDTMAESFQQLLSPVESRFIDMFKMNNDALGLYHCSSRSTVHLWVLQDGSWSMNHRINLDVLPVLDPEGGVANVLPVLDPEGDVLLLSQRVPYLMLISGANGGLLAWYEWEHSSRVLLCRHMFKESLVHHDFFSMEGNAGGGVDENPLFDGLSTVALVRNISQGWSQS